MSVDRRSLDLLADARSDPAAVLQSAPQLVDELEDNDSIAVAYRAMSIAARNAATIAESVEFAKTGADIAEDRTVWRECLITLAGSLSDAGQLVYAIEVLDDASVGAKGLIVGQIEFQRGVIGLQDGSDLSSTVEAFERSHDLFAAHSRPDFDAMALHNLGWVYTQIGELGKAQAALLAARAIEEQLGRHMDVSGTDNNLGILASYRGDIPEALRLLALSDEREMKHAGTNVPRHVSRCEVLISAGLFREALALAKRIAAGARDKGRGEDQADAVLVAARAAALAGELNEAVELGHWAVSRFRRQGQEVRAAQAELVVLEARFEGSGATSGLAADAIRLADDLDRADSVVAAARARALAARIAIEVEDVDSARSSVRALGEGKSGPVELRVQRWEARARLRLAEGNPRGAASAARAGLNLLDDYQSGLGASDLRVGIERQGAGLGAIGLRMAVDSGRPRRVFEWMERTRARALRYPPVVPDESDPEQPLLVELRRVSHELRTPENRSDRRLLAQRRRLQDELRTSSRVRRLSNEKGRRFGVDEIVDALGSSTLVEIGRVDESLFAVTAKGGRFRFHELGSASQIEDELRRLRFDIRRTARLGRDPKHIHDRIERFDDLVLGSIGELSDEVVVVPSGPLLAAPWSVLPSLLDRTVMVAPSAEMWWRSRRGRARARRVVLAAGPQLEHATNELASLVALYADPRVFGPDARTGEFGKAARGARMVHAVCHASFEVENPMFSALRLGDGDFNVYDIERLGRAPSVMVLSACDSGYTETQAGDELTGLASALLSMGTRSVVASVGLVPDTDATARLMLALHRGLIAGDSPPAALAKARNQSVDDPAGYLAAASFVCIGGG